MTRFYRITTEWYTRPENALDGPPPRPFALNFRRTHYRAGNTCDAAIKKQQAHNRKRAREGMTEDGWRWRIVAVRHWTTL